MGMSSGKYQIIPQSISALCQHGRQYKNVNSMKVIAPSGELVPNAPSCLEGECAGNVYYVDLII